MQPDIGMCISLEVGDIGKDQEQSRRADDSDALNVHSTERVSYFVDLKELCNCVSRFYAHHSGVRRSWALRGAWLSVCPRHPRPVRVDDVLVILHAIGRLV